MMSLTARQTVLPSDGGRCCATHRHKAPRARLRTRRQPTGVPRSADARLPTAPSPVPARPCGRGELPRRAVAVRQRRQRVASRPGRGVRARPWPGSARPARRSVALAGHREEGERALLLLRDGQRVGALAARALSRAAAARARPPVRALRLAAVLRAVAAVVVGRYAVRTEPERAVAAVRGVGAVTAIVGATVGGLRGGGGDATPAARGDEGGERGGGQGRRARARRGGRATRRGATPRPTRARARAWRAPLRA